MSGGRREGRPKFFRLPATRHRLRGEIERELRFHIEGRIEELVAQGYPREQAEREVRERFGDVATVRNECEEIDTMTQRKRELGEWRAALAALSEEEFSENYERLENERDVFVRQERTGFVWAYYRK